MRPTKKYLRKGADRVVNLTSTPGAPVRHLAFAPTTNRLLQITATHAAVAGELYYSSAALALAFGGGGGAF